MEKDRLTKLLKTLIHLDIDAWHAYGQAIEHLKNNAGIRDRLERYREDHRRHVEELSEQLKRLDVRPPDFSPDFKGYLLEGFTSLRSATGTQGALAAMKTNEELTNRKYRQALEEPLPPDLRPLVEKSLKEEQEHLRYVVQKLDLLVGEKDTPDRGQYY